MAFDAKKEYASLKARTDKYATDISKIYSNAVNELLKLVPAEAGEEFSFDDNPRIAKKASDILRRMQAAAETAIRKGIKLEWAMGNKAADEFLSTMFGKKVLNGQFVFLRGKGAGGIHQPPAGFQKLPLWLLTFRLMLMILRH